MSHYTKEELELYRHNQMSKSAQTRCAKHLNECQACATLIEELEQDDKLLAEIKSSVKVYQKLTDITKKSNISL